MLMKLDNSISTNELRFQFEKVLRAMSAGKELILTYRNKPLARIAPYQKQSEAIPADDPFYSLADIAEPLGSLSSEDIDKLIYG